MIMARFAIGGRQLSADFARPLSIAVPLEFGGPQPSCFDAPPATARPLEVGAFLGDTRAGGSCNCELLTLAPHCNGTHTECVGHVTEERVAVTDCVKGGIVFALLVSLAPVAAASTPEDSDPVPAEGDLLVTAAALQAAAARHFGPDPRALIIRTRGGADRSLLSYRGPAPAPYLSRQAAASSSPESLAKAGTAESSAQTTIPARSDMSKTPPGNPMSQTSGGLPGSFGRL